MMTPTWNESSRPRARRSEAQGSEAFQFSLRFLLCLMFFLLVNVGFLVQACKQSGYVYVCAVMVGCASVLLSLALQRKDRHPAGIRIAILNALAMSILFNGLLVYGKGRLFEAIRPYPFRPGSPHPAEVFPTIMLLYGGAAAIYLIMMGFNRTLRGDWLFSIFVVVSAVALAAFNLWVRYWILGP